MEHVIRVENLGKQYGEGDTLVKALDDVSLTIKTGEFTAIVGPSGSGKSTLLHLIGGLDKPKKGAVYLTGQNIYEMSESNLSDFRRDHIGFIFQSYNLIPVLSAEENIEYIMLLQGLSASERRSRVSSIMEDLDLSNKLDRRPYQLSGGQQQRVAVARAMVSKPNLILADEPTANLDSKNGTQLLDLMKGLNEKEGMTFVFSTHDPMIMEQATRIITLKDGSIVDDKTK